MRRGSRRGSRRLALADRGSRWAGQIVVLALAVASVGRLALCLSSLSVTASRRHRCDAASRTLAQSRRGSLTFLSSSFFSFFSFGFSVFAFSVWFWTAEAEIFCCGLTWVMAL